MKLGNFGKSIKKRKAERQRDGSEWKSTRHFKKTNQSKKRSKKTALSREREREREKEKKKKKNCSKTNSMGPTPNYMDPAFSLLFYSKKQRPIKQ
jgi:hypothetical protein